MQQQFGVIALIRGRDHAQSEAEALVRRGLQRFKLSQSDLGSLPGSDPRKVAIADSIHKSTTTPLGWTAERLQMKSAANVSQQLGRLRRRQIERPSSRRNQGLQSRFG